jgi:hypothetical protein
MNACTCKHFYPCQEVRDRCPIHRADVRPPGHDFWDGSLLRWLKEPVWRGQKPQQEATDAR